MAGRTAGGGGICGWPPGGWTTADDGLPPLAFDGGVGLDAALLLVWGPAPPEDEYCEYRARP